jgi:hypothetical protein
MAVRPPMPVPQMIETPAMRRSAMLAKLLEEQRQPVEIKGGYGELAARLLGQGITQFGANRAERAVRDEREATREAFLAGLPVAPEAAPSGPDLAAALVAPQVTNTQEPQQADIAPIAPVMGSPMPSAAPAGVPAAPMPMTDVPPMPQPAPAPVPMAPQAPAQPQMPPQLAAYVRQLAQTDLAGAQAVYGNWQQQQAMMSQLPEAIRNDPIAAWAATQSPEAVAESYGMRYRPVTTGAGSRTTYGPGEGSFAVEQPSFDTSGDTTLRRTSTGVMPVYTRVTPSIDEQIRAENNEQERRLELLRLELDRDKYGSDQEYRQALLDLDRRRLATTEGAPRPGDNEDRAAIAGFEAANQRFAAQLRNIAGDPEAGIPPAFDLSPGNALRYKAALATGIGMTPEAAAYGDYVSEIRAAVSDALRLNTGPQTDQDAIREAEALLSNVDNREYVMRRLPTVMANNDRLRAGRQRLLQERRSVGGPVQSGAPDPLEGRTATGPNNERLVRRGGQWVQQ